MPTEREPLYIAEHMAAEGLGDQDLADLVGVDRVTVTRWRNEGRRPRPDMMPKVAAALKKTQAELRQPPDRPSLDAIVRDATPELHKMAFDIVRRLVSGGQ